MDILNFSILCILFTLVVVVALQSLTRGSKTSSGKLPPGPAPFPFIGNLLKLGDRPHKSLAELAKTHGPLMTLKLGHITTIVISSATIAKEVLQKHDLTFSNRSIPDAIRAHKHHEAGMPWLPVSTTWRNLRKICNSHIFTSKKLDANQVLRHKKVQQLLANVQESCRAGRAVDIGQEAFNTSLNLLSNTIFSVDLADPSSDTGRELKELVWSIMEDGGRANLADYFPVIKKIDPQGNRRRLAIHFGKMMDLFDRIIDQRLQQRIIPGSTTSNDMLDNLLDVSEDCNEELDRTHIKHLLLDLFGAGTDTTSSTLEWAMGELLHNPDTLSKARLELEWTIGKGNQVEESDITRLPYLQAIVRETLRMHPAVPFLIPRKARADVEMNGYIVPNGAQLLVNAWAIGRDPNIWDNPNSFVPERFLGSNIDVRGQNFELIPFGAGRRICPGLPLAIRMLHLMLGNLIQSFDWKLENGVAPEEMNMEDKFGITVAMDQPLRAIPIPL